MADTITVDRVESALGRKLQPDEEYELVLWDRGRTLAQISPDVWQIIFDTLKNYRDDAVERLSRTSPGNENIKELHAVSYALTDLYDKFRQDIDGAISAPLPGLLKKALRSEVPPESL